RSLAVDLAPRIGEVADDVLDAAAPGDLDLAFACALHSLEQLVLDLHVPGEIVFPRLHDGARGRDGVAPTLHLQAVEEGPVRLVITLEDLGADDVAGLEVDDAVRACADRLEVGRRLARPCPLEGREDVLGDDAPKRARPEGS